MKVLARNTTSVQRAVQVSASTNKIAARSAFTGVRVPAARRATPNAASQRSAVRTMALFGGAKTTLPDSIYDIKVTTIDGKEISMSQFKGKVLMIANVASACGMTPQYADFVELYDKYKSKGLEILAFPCNAFGSQESGSNSQIKQFAQNKGAKFTMLAKGEVNGPGELPLWTFLKAKQGGLLGSDIKWNFTKFLVDRNGNVVSRYAPTSPPLAFENDIKALL